MKDAINKLKNIPAPSGFESTLIDEIEKIISPLEARRDFMGSLIAKKEGTGAKILIETSIDHDSIVVNHIDDKGFVRFYPSSGFAEKDTLGRQFVFASGASGLVGTEELLDGKPQFSKMFIDIGCKDKATASKLVAIGDHACLPMSTRIEGDRIIAAGNGNITAAILATVAKEVEAGSNNLVFAFTVQGKLGGRGALAVLTGEEPDVVINIDLYPATDTPGHPDKVTIELDAGPVLVVAGNGIFRNKAINDTIKSVAASANIPLQLAINDKYETKEMRLGTAAKAAPMATIALPARKYGEGIVCSMKDALSLSKLAQKVSVKKLLK
jgi:endoglucanase